MYNIPVFFNGFRSAAIVLSVMILPMIAVPASAASVVGGGVMTMNLDRKALAAAFDFDETEAPSIYLEEFFDVAAASGRTRDQILEDHLVAGSGEINANGLTFTINGRTVENADGRNSMPTDFSFNRADFAGTATGAIGLAGATRFRVDTGLEQNRIVSGDYTLEFDAENIDAASGRSGWTLYNHLYFESESFNLFDVQMETLEGSLLLSGLIGVGEGFEHLRGTKDAIVGDFTLQAAVIPLPAACWMFFSALLGLLGLRKSRAGSR